MFVFVWEQNILLLTIRPRKNVLVFFLFFLQNNDICYLSIKPIWTVLIKRGEWKMKNLRLINISSALNRLRLLCDKKYTRPLITGIRGLQCGLCCNNRSALYSTTIRCTMVYQVMTWINCVRIVVEHNVVQLNMTKPCRIKSVKYRIKCMRLTRRA